MVTVMSTNPHPSVIKEAICRNCGATLNYVPADIQNKTVADYTGDREVIHFIKCPPCGNEIWVKRH